MKLFLACLFAFGPAALFGWANGAWAPSLSAGAIMAALLWAVFAASEWVFDQSVRLLARWLARR